MRPATIRRKVGDRQHVERTQVVGAGFSRCGCGKQTYTSKKLAKATAAHQSRESGELIEAYHCFAAHGYHIGHPPRPFDFRREAT